MEAGLTLDRGTQPGWYPPEALPFVHVEPCDLILTHGNSTLGRLIRWAERTPGEEPSWTNHAGIFTMPGLMKDAGAAESLWRTEFHQWWPNHIGNEVSVYRPVGLTQQQAEAVLERMRKYQNAKYGWWKLPLHLIDNKVLGGAHALRRLQFLDSRPFCSYSAGHAYDAGGRHFYNRTGNRIDPDDLQPDDMEDDVIRREDAWQCIVFRSTVTELPPVAPLPPTEIAGAAA